MAFKVLDHDIQKFITENTGKPVTALALQKNPFPGADWTEIIGQIAAREKAKDKLPTWFAVENIVYPSKISVEQTSSEVAAQYKAGLVSGDSLIDLTGGFGVDDYYFSKKVGQVTHCELNEELSEIAAHNFRILALQNIKCIAGDSLDTLKNSGKHWDYIYIDPSRRSDVKGKVFMLKDCLPNVPDLLDTYFSYSDNILIKTAPILDITAGLSEIHSVKEVHIVAVNSEVKELLWVLEKGYDGSPELIAVSLNKDYTDIFTTSYDNDAHAFYSLPQKYLYEPNSAIMKSGAFDAVCQIYNVAKLHNNSQLYTSDFLINFPGRRFTINDIIPYQKLGLKSLQGTKMNVTVRNFPLSVEEIRKKLKLKDGGDIYAFFTTNMQNEKIVLLCGKI
ncbi:MAG: class I SAM-dependent methyltransferase [Flavobacterium sp.]|nr:MAG: class I SAM-dependent methyltransferase [Flavobacterium sp.]